MAVIALHTETPANTRRQREEWLRTLDVADRDDAIFELETTLKALDRFFNIENLPINPQEQIITRDFSTETRIIATACRNVSRLARYLLREEASAFTFRSYIENRMMSDRTRDAFNTEHVAQGKPAESLYLLGASFQNLADMAHALTRLNSVSYPLFVAMGQMVSRAIASNRFFNPMGGDHFHPSQDKMKNTTVAQVVRGIADRDLRKHVSITLLAFFRLMRYLELIDWETEKRDELRESLLLLGLVQSESRSLIQYLEKEIPAGLAKTRSRKNTALFLDVADSLSFQFSMELRKVYQHILRDLLGTGSVPRLRSAVSSAVGILRNFLEQSVVLVVHTYEPTIKGRTIFSGFVSKVEQSVRLREDIWVLNKICDVVEQRISKQDLAPETFAEALRPLADFVDYFMGLSFKFVRYSDHDEMERFFLLVRSLSSSASENPHKLQDFRKKINYFNRFVETTLGHIRHRQELQDLPLDTDHARRLLEQFIG